MTRGFQGMAPEVSEELWTVSALADLVPSVASQPVAGA